MTTKPKIIAMAENAANQAVDNCAIARDSDAWKVAKDAAIIAISDTAASLERLASQANISVPLAPGLADGAAIARRSILDAIESFMKA